MESTTTIAVSELIDLSQNLALVNLGYLTVSVAIIAILGGIFYLFNIKPLKESLGKQEQTLTELNSEVRENLSSSKKELQSDLDKFKSAQLDSTSSLMKQENDKVAAQIEAKIASFVEEFTAKFNFSADEKDKNLKTVISAEIDNKLRVLEKGQTQIIENNKIDSNNKIETLKKMLSSHETALKDTKRKVRELEVFKYSQKGQMGAIYGLIELLRDAIDEDSWRIDQTLEDLNAELAGITLDGELTTRIEEQLVRLDSKPKYLPLVTKIRKNYKI